MAPLLRYLDRERLPYDLTTDLSLARGEGPALGNAPGVAFAGSALWLPEPLLRRLRDEVADGLRVASFGADAFRRTVRLRGDRLVDPRRAAGERVRRDHRRRCTAANAPLTVFEDGLGLFEGLDSFIGDFTRVRAVAAAAHRGAHDRHRRPRPEPARVRGLRAGRRHRDPLGHRRSGRGS